MPRICLTIPNATPQPYRFPLDTEIVTIGRSAANDVVVEHGSISSHHCEMKRVQGGFILSDCQSTNGIKVEGNRMDIIDLMDGLDAEVGDVLFNYQLTEEELTTLSEEKFKSQQKKKSKKKKKAPAEQAAAPVGPPRPIAPPQPVFEKDTSTRDFLIFLACAVVALFAFYLGLNSAHRASFPKEERLGKSVWSDKIFPSAEEEPASEG